MPCPTPTNTVLLNTVLVSTARITAQLQSCLSALFTLRENMRPCKDLACNTVSVVHLTLGGVNGK